MKYLLYKYMLNDYGFVLMSSMYILIAIVVVNFLYLCLIVFNENVKTSIKITIGTPGLVLCVVAIAVMAYNANLQDIEKYGTNKQKEVVKKCMADNHKLSQANFKSLMLQCDFREAGTFL